MRAAVAISLPVYLALLLEYPHLRPKWSNPLNTLVVGFLLVNVVAALLGGNWTQSFWGTYERMGGVVHLLHLTLFYLYLLALGQAGPNYLKKLAGLLIGIAGLSSLYGICEVLNSEVGRHDLFYAHFHRVSSIFGNPAFFASFLLFPMAFTLFGWLRSPAARHKRVYEVLFALQLSTLMLTGERGALLGFIAGICLCGTLLCVKTRRFPASALRPFWLAGLASAIVLGIMIWPQSPFNSVFRHLSQFQDASATQRLILWRCAWRAYLDNPLWGLGPENFYTAFYKYFDRRLYQVADYYALFDKPHNQVLELLSTTGTLGFLAYGGILVLAVMALWRGYQRGRLSWSQFAVLVSGILAYQVQDCFLFDTPAALVTFYFCLAFAAVQWNQIVPAQNTPASTVFRLRPWFLWSIVAVTAYGAYVLYGGVADAIHESSTGMMVTTNDAKAIQLFGSAARSPFAFDRRALASCYLRLADSDETLTPEQFDVALDEAIAVLERTTRQITDDPRLWLQLASLYSQKAELSHSLSDPRAGVAIHRAVDLAPEWIEPLNYLAQYEASSGRYGEATRLAARLVGLLPNNGEVRWNLATIYKIQNQEELAIKTARRAVELGYRFRSAKEVRWLSDYYTARQDYDQLIELYNTAIRARPHDITLYRGLVRSYLRVGEKQKALAVAIRAPEVDSSNQQRGALIRSLE